MMQMIYKWSGVAMLAALLLTTGCTKDETKEERFVIDATEVTLTNGNAGSTDILIVSSIENPEAVVETSAQEWLTAEISKRCLTLTYTKNEGEEPRTGVVNITAGLIERTVTITQPVYVEPVIKEGFEVGDAIDEGLGMVYWVDESNSKIAKAISVARTTGLVWGPDAASGAMSFTNGADNSSKLTTSDFAAAYYCSQMGEGWYLPARDELVELFEVYNGTTIDKATIQQPEKISAAEKEARATFDAYLAALGGEPMNSAVDNNNGNSYWSSTESEVDFTQAYFVRFGKYTYEPISKGSSTRFVRCVKVMGDYEYAADPVAVTLSPATVTLEGEQGDVRTVTATIVNGRMTSVESSAAWCTATFVDNIITLTAAETNTTGASRSAEVTVHVESTTGGDPATATITVNQKPHVESGYKVGDLYSEGGAVVGVVFWVSENGQSAKVVSLNRSETTVAWSKVGAECLGATSDTDGVANTTTLMASVEANDIPALESCVNGWYWPAIDEWKEIFAAYNGTSFEDASNVNTDKLTETEKTARAAFDKLLTDNGGVALNVPATGTGDQYWSSTEFVEDGGIYAKYIRVGKRYIGGVGDTPVKTGDTKRYVRWIKQIGEGAKAPVKPGEPVVEPFEIDAVYMENGTPKGVIFWVSPDGKSAKVVSLTRTESTIAWSKVGAGCLGATSDTDGVVNTATLAASAEAADIPMLDYCASLGSGWYWPAINEMKALFEHYNGTTFEEATNKNTDQITDTEKTSRAAFDKILTDNGGVALNVPATGTGDQYWSSTEFVEDGGIYAKYIRFGKKYIGGVGDTPLKTGDTKRYGRAMKIITQ